MVASSLEIRSSSASIQFTGREKSSNHPLKKQFALFVLVHILLINVGM